MNPAPLAAPCRRALRRPPRRGRDRRYALVAGANDGGPERPRLQIRRGRRRALRARAGGAGRRDLDDAILLKQPGLRELEAALGLSHGSQANRARARAGRAHRARRLLLRPRRREGAAARRGPLLVSRLRDRLDEVPADVRIAVLDACASGAITRLKGGQLRLPFLVDASSAMRGHAFLTSSAETRRPRSRTASAPPTSPTT